MALSTHKIKRIDIVCFLLFFSIVKIHAVPQFVQQVMKISFIFIVLIYLASKGIKRMMNMGLLLACVFVIPSVISILTKSIDLKTFLDGVLNAIVVYATYTFIRLAAERCLLNRILNDLFYYDAIACFISLISVLSFGRSIYLAGTKYEYFFGNKYATMYLFIFLIGFASVKFFSDRKKRIERRGILLFLIVLEIFLSYWVKCSTTMIGGFIMFFTILFSGKRTEWIRKFISNPIFSVIYFILPGFLAMNMVAIMQIPSIREFVTGMLGKSAGLTGRVYIYSTLKEIFLEKPIFGYGYNSDVVNKITEVGNAQNGLFQMLIEFGIVGVVIVTIIVYKSFYTSRSIDALWGIKVSVFTICICSVVEISYNYLFYLGLFILKFGYGYNASYIINPIKKYNKRRRSLLQLQ